MAGPDHVTLFKNQCQSFPCLQQLGYYLQYCVFFLLLITKIKIVNPDSLKLRDKHACMDRLDNAKFSCQHNIPN